MLRLLFFHVKRDSRSKFFPHSPFGVLFLFRSCKIISRPIVWITNRTHIKYEEKEHKQTYNKKSEIEQERDDGTQTE